MSVKLMVLGGGSGTPDSNSDLPSPNFPIVARFALERRDGQFATRSVRYGIELTIATPMRMSN
jgi:hypothetical protein